MARSLSQIKNSMLNDIAADEVLMNELTSTSKYAIFRLFTFIVATAIWIHESFFDTHTAEVNQKLANQKAGTLPWYRTMALAFQFGFDLIQDQDIFNNGTATADEIEASKIIKYCAVNEAQDSSRVIIKIAGEVNGELTDFTDNTQVEAIEMYLDEIRFAGVELTIINYKADQLYLNIQIKRDALLINENGMSINGGNYPVNEALQEFMKELPFNGELRLSALVDKLQVIPGVIDATVLSAQSSWINPDLGGYDIPQPIFISKVPVSGYFKIVDFDSIAYVV